MNFESVSIDVHILRLSTETGGKCLCILAYGPFLLLHIFQTDENEAAFERMRVQRTAVRIRARTQTQSTSSNFHCVSKISCIFDYIHADRDSDSGTDTGTREQQQQIRVARCAIQPYICYGFVVVAVVVVALMIITLCLFEILLFRVRLKSMRARCRSLFVSCILV